MLKCLFDQYHDVLGCEGFVWGDCCCRQIFYLLGSMLMPLYSVCTLYMLCEDYLFGLAGSTDIAVC